MKQIVLILVLALSFSACKKTVSSINQDNVKSWYRIGAIKGTDTVRSISMNARTETVGLVMAEDDKLRVELISFQNINGVAYYTVQATNKQPCQMILRWGWQDIGVTSIQPNDSTANTPQSDVLKANQVKVYIVSGLAKVGSINVKGEHINNDCANSSTLIINITTTVLPVTYLSNSIKYYDNTGVVISFTVDDPAQVDTYVIEKLVSTTWKIVYQFTCDKKTTSYNIPILADEIH